MSCPGLFQSIFKWSTFGHATIAEPPDSSGISSSYNCASQLMEYGKVVAVKVSNRGTLLKWVLHMEPAPAAHSSSQSIMSSLNEPPGSEILSLSRNGLLELTSLGLATHHRIIFWSPKLKKSHDWYYYTHGTLWPISYTLSYKYCTNSVDLAGYLWRAISVQF